MIELHLKKFRQIIFSPVFNTAEKYSSWSRITVYVEQQHLGKLFSKCLVTAEDQTTVFLPTWQSWNFALLQEIAFLAEINHSFEESQTCVNSAHSCVPLPNLYHTQQSQGKDKYVCWQLDNELYLF